MQEFSGTLAHGTGTSHYQVRWGGYSVLCCPSPMFDDCNVGFIPSFLPYNDRSAYLAYAWGYEGHGPTLLAGALLGFYGAPDRIEDIRSHINRCIQPVPNRRGSLDEQSDFIKKHYRAFTSEIIANLPDNWTMTMDDIDKWVKEKEKQYGMGYQSVLGVRD